MLNVSEGGRSAIRRCITAAASLLLVCVLTPELWPAPTADSTKIALVQYWVSPADYRSEAAFARSVGDLTAQAAAGGAKIVVFPEYLNVFLAAVPLGTELTEAGSLPDILALLKQHYGRPVGLPEYLRLRSGSTRAIMDRVWGRLARRHKLWIIAGSSFVAEPADDPNAQLFNRAFVYGPDGRVAYTQDKVYLTPFEKKAVGLSAGDLSAAQTFEAAGLTCALTLCRDTFFEVWHRPFAQADIWFDLKANGVEFDQQARQTFTTALPERIADTGVPRGATVCLTGRFFDLFWEGESSLVVPSESSPNGYVTKKKTADPAAEAILYFTIQS
ncbi:MAG: nitrilase-related carbon-nitrogen hydrolase [bacterium]